MNAIILAAGKGERLKPLTDTVPKPLIEVSGKTLLERNINRLFESGVRNIIINGSKMGEKIELFLEKYQQSVMNIEFINEGEEPLGTAGAIFNIIDIDLINEDQFWVINADIMTNFSFKSISLKPGIMGHVVLVPNPEHNPNGDFVLMEIELPFLIISDILSVESVSFLSTVSNSHLRGIFHWQIY